MPESALRHPMRTCRYEMWLTALWLLSGCEAFTDAATRLAYDIKAASGQLQKPGDRVVLRHETPSRAGDCDGPYTVQLDRVGALIIWCRSEHGEVLSSPGTSYHRQFVDTADTFYLEKGAGETLVIELEQQGNKAVIVNAY